MLNFKNKVSKIGGWLTRREGEFLYKSAKNLSPKAPVVEIGSWKGRSTICLATGAKEVKGYYVYAVDHHKGSSEHLEIFGKIDTFEQFKTNIKKSEVSKYIKPIKLSSEKASKKINKKISMLLIDGSHEINNVRNDFKLWFPKVIKGGFVCFHDTFSFKFPGPGIVTAEILLSSKHVRKPKMIDTMTYFEKCEKNTTKERLINKLFIAYRILPGLLGSVRINLCGTNLK